MELKHTPGPWSWAVNEKAKDVLLTGGRGQSTVMSFGKYGARNSQPFFKDVNGYEMKPAWHLSAVVPGREHHDYWFKTIDHPDAHLIAAAPDLLEAIIFAEERMSDAITTMHPDTYTYHSLRDTMIVLVNAINKATGVTPVDPKR